ncbi:AI-2E family transporter [Nakamurella sp.]|uniref:AI-2E family transporter n=1 Tax=Nakamurella sp. TaxID=1869182 RepID=UPI003B3B734B
MTPHLGRRRRAAAPDPTSAPADPGAPISPGSATPGSAAPRPDDAAGAGGAAGPARPADGAAPADHAAPAPRPRRIRISLDQREIQAATIRILVIVSIWLVAAWVVGVVQHFLFLILLAWLAAIALEPAIRWFLRRGVRRSRATAAVAVPVVVVLIGLVVVFEQMLFDQAAQLVQSAPSTVRTIVAQLNATFGLQLDPAQILVTLKLEPDQIQQVANDLALGAIGYLGSVLAVVFDLVTVAVFTFYIAAAGPRLIQEVAVWLPPGRQLILGEIWEIAEQKTGGYVASKVVLAALSAFFHGVFFLAVGLPGWLPLALLAGITAQFVPVIGTYIGVAAPVIVALADRPITAVWIVLFAIVYQQIETYVLTPRISRRTMEVNPALALAAVFIGAAIWGPIGAIIGVPIVAVVVSVFQTYGRRYELVPHLADAADRDRADPPPADPTG